MAVIDDFIAQCGGPEPSRWLSPECEPLQDGFDIVSSQFLIRTVTGDRHYCWNEILFQKFPLKACLKRTGEIQIIITSIHYSITSLLLGIKYSVYFTKHA